MSNDDPYTNAADTDANADATGETGGTSPQNGAPAPNPDSERDTDLTPVAGEPALSFAARLAVHVVFWSVYSVAFIGHAAIHMLRIPAGMPSIRAMVRAVSHLRFFRNRNQAVLYLRASWLFTPATLLPFMPGESPVREDPAVPRRETVSEDVKTATFRRDDYVCQNCGAGGGPHGDAVLQVDHAVPKSRGGNDSLDDLRTLCRQCHQARHARTF